jgi:hypothetical protein
MSDEELEAAIAELERKIQLTKSFEAEAQPVGLPPPRKLLPY